jgi:hypothetical protein
MLGLPRPVFLSNTVKSGMQEVDEMNDEFDSHKAR